MSTYALTEVQTPAKLSNVQDESYHRGRLKKEASGQVTTGLRGRLSSVSADHSL